MRHNKETEKMAIRQATKKMAKIRGAFYSISGGGKTLSTLRVGAGLVEHEAGGKKPAPGQRGRLGMIDSEDGDSELYADRVDFDVMVLGRPDTHPKTIEGYTAALDEFAVGGYACVIIDSLSHAWRELLEEVDNNKRSGNSFQAWADATPKQKRFVEAIKKFPGHVLVTMRADTAWEVSTNDKGKKEPIRVGLKPEQGKGIEYEFTWLCQLNPDNSMQVLKDRTGKFQGKYIELCTEAFGRELGAWLADGRKPVSAEQREEIRERFKALGKAATRTEVEKLNNGRALDLFEDGEAVLAKLDEMVAAHAAGLGGEKPLGGAEKQAGPTPTGPSAEKPSAPTDTTPSTTPTQPTTSPPTERPTEGSGSPSSQLNTEKTDDGSLIRSGMTDSRSPSSEDGVPVNGSAGPPASSSSSTGASAASDNPSPAASKTESSSSVSAATPPENGSSPTATSPSPSSDGEPKPKGSGVKVTKILLGFAAAVDTCRKEGDVVDTKAAWTSKLQSIPREDARGWCEGYAQWKLDALAGVDSTTATKDAVVKITALRGAA